MVEELLLGDNPFIGVSHLSYEKAREELSEATLENKVKVIEAAVNSGATGFTFSTHDSNLKLLRHLRDNCPDLACKLNYYVLVPYVAKYVREAAFSGTQQLIKRVFINNVSLRNLIFALYPEPINFIKLFLETELREYLDVLPRNRVKAILLHEGLTELIIAFNLRHVVRTLTKHFHKKDLNFGLETRNVKCLMCFLKEGQIMIKYLMTPLNPLGYQMTPSRIEAEESIIGLSRDGVKVIAINTLASGVVNIDEAVNYLSYFKEHIFAIAVGTSKSQRATEIFTRLSRLKQTC
jgi:hypothetical protein